MSDKLLTLKEMADALSVHPETLRGYALSGRVRYYKLPSYDGKGELRFDPSEVRDDLRREPNVS